MAKEFLGHLLKIENSVQSNDRQRCTICLQDIGSLSSETGIIECQIRLPCTRRCCPAGFFLFRSLLGVARHLSEVFVPRFQALSYDSDFT